MEIDVLRDLERFAPVKAVHGNMDPGEVSQRFPESFSGSFEGFRICMTHGSGPGFGLEKRVFRKFIDDEPDIIIFGHSHLYTKESKDGVLLLNPGAVSDSKGKRSMAVLTLVEGREPKVEKITF